MIKGQETDTLILINGQTFTTDGDSVKDVNGVTVGHIQKEGDSIIFHGNHGAEVNLSVVNGRLIVTDVKHPIDPDYGVIPTPDHPIELDPEYGIGTAPTYGDILEVGGAVIIKGDGENQAIVRMDDQGNAIVFINDYNNGYVISNSEIHDTDGNLVGHASKEGDNYIVRLEDGTEVVFRNDNGRLFAAVIARPDIDNPIRDGIIDHGNIGDSIEIKVNNRGQIIVGNGMVVGDSGYRVEENTTGTVIKNPEGEVIGQTKTKEFNYGLTYSLVKTEHGVTIVQGRKNALAQIDVEGAKTITQDQIDSIKDKAKSLSQEQRQQIKQAIKDRAPRS